MFLQQLELLSPNKGLVNQLILSFNHDLVPVPLRGMSFGVRAFLYGVSPERISVPHTLTFWTYADSEATGRTHIPSLVLTGELSSCNHIAIACHCRGNPAGRPPSNCRPAPSQPGQAAAPTHRSRLRGWVSGSRRGSGERARPRPRPPHSRAHTPARARCHTRAHAHGRRARDDPVSCSPRGPGRAAGSPRGRSWPPRPAPRSSRAGRAVGYKLSPRESAKAARRLGLGSALRCSGRL